MQSNKKQIRERFTHALVHVSKRWRWCLDKRLSRTGLTQARWSTLLQVKRGGEGLGQRQLADFVGIEGATLVPLLDSLTKLDLVERRPDPDDRRVKTVHLTRAAEPVLDEIETIADDLRSELLTGVADSDLRACIRVLEHIRARIPAAAENAVSEGE
ncbi:MAG: MarR family transcriptional regulator [Gammaproteobacteria bacterium]|nr:MarR family transcriptional regulator [Gammaproteobacteria bacterium]|tara:strand:- start:132 stop:602 length:471 start_codon:yes stop_codon:yes gene_type:complete